jgi:hypothetical protein
LRVAFGGGYRIWWWASITFAIAGASVLSDAHIAVASTIMWLSGPESFGSITIYRLLPAFLVIGLILPSLQSDMRGCITSRVFIFVAAALWLGGSAAFIGEDYLQRWILFTRLRIPVPALAHATLMAGTVCAFTGVLFHARHVVYESVEPPERKPGRRDRIATAGEESADVTASTAPGRKPRRASRSTKAKATAVARDLEVNSPTEAIAEVTAAEPERNASGPPVQPTERIPAASKESMAPPKRREPSASMRPVQVSRDEPEDEPIEDEPVRVGGRNVRLDGPEELRGLSKRERRKLRKAMKGQDCTEVGGA